MENKILNTFHDRMNETDNFILMIDKYKKPNDSNENFMELLKEIEINEENKYTQNEQNIAAKMVIVFSELLM